MKKPGIDYLRESGEFIAYKELRFNDILSFVLENIRYRNLATIFYFLINLLFFILFVVFSVNGIASEVLNFRAFLAQVGWGMLAGGIIIIPFHEGFHALAFLLIGARKIRFGADFRQMLFYATAENFVAGRKGFSVVALAPFLIINIASAFYLLYFGYSNMVLITVMLLMHNIMCIGDFAMLSFFIRNKDKEMYTFDDLDTKTAWFYIRAAKKAEHLAN